jgi:hypothetical protein
VQQQQNTQKPGTKNQVFSTDYSNLDPRLKGIPSATSDYLGKGGQFERGVYGGDRDNYVKLQQFLKKVPPSTKSSMPIHLRALWDYLLGRETPWTAADMTKEEQKFLKSVAIPNAKKKGLTYPLWKEIGAGNLPTAMTVAGSEKEKEKLKNNEGGSLLKPEMAGQFMYFLGQVDPPAIKVAPDNTMVTVNDMYDFNTQGKTKEDLIKNFSDQLSSWWKGNSTFYSVLRNAVSFRELGDYKGFPVKITV